MFNAEVLVVTRNKQSPNDLKFFECHLEGWGHPVCRNLISFEVDYQRTFVHEKGFYVEFVRDLNKQDRFTKRITPDKQSTYLVWAQTYKFQPIDIDHHEQGKCGVVVVDFSNNKQYEHKTNYDFWKEFHNWGLMISWTLGIDLLVLLGRYGRTLKYYHYLHGIGFCIIYIVTC